MTVRLAIIGYPTGTLDQHNRPRFLNEMIHQFERDGLGFILAHTDVQGNDLAGFDLKPTRVLFPSKILFDDGESREPPVLFHFVEPWGVAFNRFQLVFRPFIVQRSSSLVREVLA